MAVLGELGCQADSTAACEDGVAAGAALQSGEGGEAEATLRKHFSHPSDPRFEESVTDSCGCVWCDVGLPVISGNNGPGHETRDGVIYLCSKPQSPDEEPALAGDAECSLTQEFTPCALELDEARITEMVLKDCFMIWEPWGNEGVEFGYDAEGNLQAIRIPDLVAGHKVLRERDTRPKDEDPQGASLASSPVPEGNSPDVPAANKSASLTPPNPQNYEAKANELYEISWRSTTSQEAVAAISSAISSAVQAERERIRGMLVSKADALAIEAQIPGDPSRTAILMAKGQAYAEASSLLSAVSDADVEEGIRIAREIRPAIEAEIASAIRQEDANG